MLLVVYGKHFSWVGEIMELTWGSWLADRSLKSFSSLPNIVSWGIWIYKNRNIFEDKVVTPQLVATSSVAIANHFVAVPSPSHVRLSPQESIDKSCPWGFFDGATQGDPSLCGAGVVLYLKEGHFFHSRWGLGEGTNNKAELLALYMLLLVAHEKGIQWL